MPSPRSKSKRSAAMPDIKANEGFRSEFPERISPMLCSLLKEPFQDPNFVYEVKWDGYRIIAFVRKGKVVLKSRGDQDYTRKFQAVADALKDLNLDTVIDGEVVVLDESGKPDFSALQNYRQGDTIAFYVFDLLWCDGYDLMSVALTERKSILKQIIPLNDVIKFSESFDDGLELFKIANTMGFEGIVAKQKDSIYTPGKKGNTWYKAKLSKRQEYVIGGWTESDNGRVFRSILFGHYVNGELIYVHHAGGGFTDKHLKELSQKLKKLEITESPFANKVDIKARKHWVKPVLVGEFDKSVQTTKIGVIRHPAIFVGLRDDKKAKDVVEEKPLKKSTVEDTIRKELTEARENKNVAKQEDVVAGSWETLNNRKITSENDLEIEGKKINLVNIERELWPDVHKADIIQYYISIADDILPHLKNRPVGLNICLGHAAAGKFFLRGMEGHAPKWATLFTTDRKHKAKGKSEKIEWLVCNDKATLVYIVNLDSIDIHPWTSRVETPEEPDYIVIDLDPSDDDFKKVIRTALAAKKLFDKHKLTSFIKTSGKTGLHLLIPCIGIPFGDSRRIAEVICKQIHRLVPDITTTNVSVSSRGNLLYIDPNQNDFGDRLAAPYCVRAHHSPSVSTPLDWKEVRNTLKPSDFTIHTTLERLQKKGDLFKNIIDAKIRKANSNILKTFL